MYMDMDLNSPVKVVESGRSAREHEVYINTETVAVKNGKTEN